MTLQGLFPGGSFLFSEQPGFRMQNRARRLFASVMAIATIACGPSSPGNPPSPVISPEGSTESPKPVSTGAGAWKLQPSSTEHLYFTTSDARLKLVDSSTTTEDEITGQTEFKFSSSREAHGSVISATVNTFTLEGGSRTGVLNTSSLMPLSVTGHLQNNKLVFALPGTPAIIDCANPVSSTLSVVQRTFIAPPTDLHTGMTWTDTTTAELCAGGVPVITGTNRNYRVLGEAVIGVTPVILLERHDRSSSTGEGSNGQHRVAIQTETAGSGQIAIDRLTGSLVDDLSTYTTSIIIRTSGRNQRFTQIVQEHTTLK